MAEDEQNTEDNRARPPYLVYQNPAEDPIQRALQEAARQLRAEGKPFARER